MTSDILPLETLPFGKNAADVRRFFEQAGWKVQRETSNQSTFFFPAAVPEELRKLPVMGESGQAPEPYTIQIFFHDGISAIAILHRFDRTERMKAFREKLIKEYGLPTFSMKERSEKTPAGNSLNETKGAAETQTHVFLLLESSVRPVEEKLKDGMNDELELRIFPKKFNEGVTGQALMEE